MVHCLAFPLLLATLPAFANTIDAGESFHRIALLIAVPVSALALIGGWRAHRRFAPLLIGSSGLLCMASGLAVEGAVETVLTVVGGVLLATAHIANWRSGAMPCRSTAHDAF